MEITPNTAKAILRGLCPRCGQGPLFEGYIGLRKQCPACGLDYAMFDAGLPLPTQLTSGRSKCFCGAEIDIAGVDRHVE